MKEINNLAYKFRRAIDTRDFDRDILFRKLSG